MSRILFDTHLLIWAAHQPELLSSEVVTALESEDVTPVFSAMSILEIAIKASLGKPDFDVSATVLRTGLLENGFEELPLDSAHAAFVSAMPLIHKDPFDRALYAQASVEGIPLWTSDGLLATYGQPVRLLTRKREQAVEALRSFRRPLPPNWHFDRDEANERRESDEAPEI